MSLKSSIIDGAGKGTESIVTNRGELVTGDLDYSAVYNVKAEASDTAYNLVSPQTGKRFVVTGFILTANKSVGVNNAIVDIYESAEGATSTTITTSLVQTEMIQNTTVNMSGIKLLSGEGVWINVKTDDDDVFCTLFGYYVNA